MRLADLPSECIQHYARNFLGAVAHKKGIKLGVGFIWATNQPVAFKSWGFARKTKYAKFDVSF